MHVTTRMSRLSQLGVMVLTLFASSALAQTDEKSEPTKGLSWKKPRVARRDEPVESALTSDTTATDTTNASPRQDVKRPLSSAQNRTTRQDRDSAADERAVRATHTVETSGVAMIRRAYDQSQDGDSEGHYSLIISQCEQGIRAGVTKETEKYAERLLSWAYNRRGKIAAEMGRDEQALEDFESAVRYDKTRWRALHNRGVSYALVGRNEEALADLTRTIEINPQYANAFYNRAELHQERGQLDDALKDYGRVIQLAPDDAAAHNSRGYCYYQLRRYPHAVRDYTEAIRLDSENSAAFANRGQLYADLGYYPRALHDYQRAVDSDPGMGKAYQGAAWLLATCPNEKFRDAEEAVAAASKAIELDGDDEPIYLDTLAAAYANAGEFDLAVQAQQASIERSPEATEEKLQRRMAAFQQKKAFRSRPIKLAAAKPDLQPATRR